MRTLIAVPCMDMVHTLFFSSVLALRKPEGSEIAISSSSLIYDARNMLAKKALNEGFDRMMWLDSDMVFDPDLMERLAADMDEGKELVSAVYFTRKTPVVPCIYKICHDTPDESGQMIPTATPVDEIPDGLFEIEGCGFGAVMVSVDLIRRIGPLPFFPMKGCGEDFSFCRKARETGATLYCDGRIRAGHIGQALITEDNWKR